LIMAHSPEIYRAMGRLVAESGKCPVEALFEDYQTLLMKGMRLRTTVRKHVNVLQHLLGYFKKHLSADEKQEVIGLIDHYRLGTLPLIVPITLLNHFIRKYDQPYLKQQIYLNPHPIELKLRNHV
jgi:uncharacterized protein YbgA (DUF1722 family)